MRLLRALSSEELSSVAKVLKHRRFIKGKTVLNEGGRGGSIYLVQSGLLKVSHEVRGRRRELGTFKPGDHFGEVSFIDKKPRSASIYAVENSELLIFSRKALEDLQHHNPHLQSKLMQALLKDLAEKLRERKFSLDFELSDLLPVNVFEADVAGNITFANRAGLDFFGYNQSEFDRGISIFDLIAPNDITKAKKEVHKALQSVKPRVLEYTAVTLNGKHFPIIFHLDPLFRDGSISGFRATLVDITERKKAEDKLRKSEEALRKAHDELEQRVFERTAELSKTNLYLQQQIDERNLAERELRSSEERYRAVMEQSSEGITLLDPQTLTILETNHAMQKMMGYSAQELRSKTIHHLTAHSKEFINSNFQRVLQGRSHSLNTMDYVHKDGSLINVEVRLDLVSFGGKLAFCSVVRDVTDKLRAEEEKRKLEENLRKAQMMETMGRLVSGVAHEVRNPLSAIQAATEAIYQDLGENLGYRPLLDNIASQVKRLSELMRDLLELGRPADRSRMQEESLHELCNSAIQLWKQTSSHFKHKVRIADDNHSSPHAIVDNARMQQVLLNLLDNAAQHTPEDRPILVKLSDQNDKVFIRVVDQGSGVESENLEKLFEPFFSTRSGGIGIGLSFVKHIVEIHGGQVSIYNNDPPPGVTVEIMLKTSNEGLPA
jgi:PAS domain S-box-containing protein